MSKTVSPKYICMYLNFPHISRSNLDKHLSRNSQSPPLQINLPPVNFANIPSVNLIHFFICSTNIH